MTRPIECLRRRLPNDAAAILAALEGHRDELVGVVVESTYNWYWLVDALQAGGYRVHLANTAAIKRYEGLKHSGDENDAVYLAHLLRWGSCRVGISAPRRRARCGIWRASACQLVRSRTAQVLAVENTLARETGAGMSSYAVRQLTARTAAGFGFDPDVERELCANVAVIRTLNTEIDKLEQRLHHNASRVKPSVNRPNLCDFVAPTYYKRIGITDAKKPQQRLGRACRLARVVNARCVTGSVRQR